MTPAMLSSEEPMPSHRRLKDEALVRPLIAALREPAFLVDAGGRVVAANAAAQTATPALRLGEHLSRGLRAPEVLDALARVLAGGDAENAAWAERAPVECWFEATVAPLRLEGFEPGAVVSLRDLTEARRVERMRADFVANASHELRTPLASLLGFVETLQGPARDDGAAREKFLGVMREQAQRMARLIDDLLSLSRIEQHLHLRPADPVDLSALTLHIAETLTHLARDNGVRLDLDAAPGVVAPGDRDELARVVENLIENAIKYGRRDSDPAPRVEVTLRQTGSTAELTVRDFGPGVAPEHIPRLTERFYRVDANKSRAKGGTGLGLAIVKHIVLRHRGRLAIESDIGEGSTFRVLLPLGAQGR